MDTLRLRTQYKVRQCSQCQGDTKFYCNTCKRGLCLKCKEKHVNDIDTKHHDVVIYREKFEYLANQESALLYDARKQQVGNEQLKLMSTPVLHTSVCVSDVISVRHISRVMSDRVWVSDICNIKLTDTTGSTIHRVKGIAPLHGGGLHTVNSSGELIYIDSEYNINKLSIDNDTVTKLLQRPLPWFLYCVYCSLSTGDLMVGMRNYKTGKVTRYNSSGQHILTIEHDNTGHTLYSEPYCITENKNGDIIVSDWIALYRGAVVVTEREGIHRFSYTGPPPGSSLDPRGICTDALSHILVCDLNTRTVQMIDKDGHFLSMLLIQQHGINEPYSLNYDDKTHLLWVGSYRTNTVSVYRYLQRRYSLTDDSVDDDKMIFKSTDGTNIWEGTSKKTELELMLSQTGKEKKDKIPVSAESIPDDLSPFTKPTSTAPEKRPPLSHYLLKSRVERFVNPFLPILDYQSPFTRIGPREKRHAIYIEHRGLHRNKPHSHSFTPDRVRNTDSGISISEHTVSVDMKESEEETEPAPGQTKKYVSTMAETLITKRWEQLKENKEADIRKSLSVNSLDNETKFRKLRRSNSLDNETKFRKLRRSQIINKDYGEILRSLDYLDCVGLNLVDNVNQGTTINPLLQSIEPFSKCSVHDFIEWMEDSKKVLRKTQSTQWGNVSSILFAVYMKEAILEFKDEDIVEVVDHSIRCAIEIENCILVSELVWTCLFDHYFQLQRMFEDMKGISPSIIETILQTVRTLILRKFPNLQNNAIILSFCFDRRQENRLVMIMSYKGNIEMKDRIPDKVLGFELVLYNFTQPSDEALSVFKSIPVSKKTPLPTVTESEARELFRKHSNLTMISASPYKSVGYSKGRHIVVEKLCISLFCLHKGYVPYGEEQFPKKIRDVEVDVQEGYCYFGAGRSLESGGHIKRLGSGTIGGFVDLPNNKVGLITCAHVVFSSEEIVNGHLTDISQIEVEAFDKRLHSYKRCGKCKCAMFPQCCLIGQPVLKPDPSVDAALIELDEDIDTFEFRAVTSEQFQSAGFDPSNPPVFSGEVVPLPDPVPVHRLVERIPNNIVKYVTATGTVIGQDYLSITTSGEVVSLSYQDPVFKVSGNIPNKLDSVVKYGAVTGFTIGNLYHSHVHIRFVQESLNLPGNLHYAVMCDQIEIQNLPQGQFFKVGDSGSFVFCINPDKTLSCLGMAVGLTSRESCLVTPIGRIIDNMCPGACLKSCGSFGTSSQHPSNTHMQQQSSDTATSHATLQLILGEMMKMRSDFQTSLTNVERNVESVQASLQNVERNFQASLHNVETEIRTLQSQVQQTEDSKTQSLSNQPSAN